jgi:hypothetical protein
VSNGVQGKETAGCVPFGLRRKRPCSEPSGRLVASVRGFAGLDCGRVTSLRRLGFQVPQLPFRARCLCDLAQGVARARGAGEIGVGLERRPQRLASQVQPAGSQVCHSEVVVVDRIAGQLLGGLLQLGDRRIGRSQFVVRPAQRYTDSRRIRACIPTRFPAETPLFRYSAWDIPNLREHLRPALTGLGGRRLY